MGRKQQPRAGPVSDERKAACARETIGSCDEHELLARPTPMICFVIPKNNAQHTEYGAPPMKNPGTLVDPHAPPESSSLKDSVPYTFWYKAPLEHLDLLRNPNAIP